MARKRRRNRSVAELEAEIRQLRRHSAAKNISSSINVALMCAAGVAVAYFAKEAIVALAGKVTHASIDVSASANASATAAAEMSASGCEWLAWFAAAPMVFGWLAILYARRAHRLRRDVVERLHAQRKEAELLLDPRRTSSRLTRRGETRPEDV